MLPQIFQTFILQEQSHYYNCVVGAGARDEVHYNNVFQNQGENFPSFGCQQQLMSLLFSQTVLVSAMLHCSYC